MTDNVIPFSGPTRAPAPSAPDGWSISDLHVEEDKVAVEMRRDADGYSVIGAATTYANAMRIARVEAQRVDAEVPPKAGRDFWPVTQAALEAAGRADAEREQISIADYEAEVRDDLALDHLIQHVEERMRAAFLLDERMLRSLSEAQKRAEADATWGHKTSGGG